MKNNSIVIWTIFIAIIGGYILYFTLNNNNQPVVTTEAKTTLNQNATDTTSMISVQSYSLADVSIHNNQNSCWTIVSGKIYDITNFISSHPAGIDKILQGCGVDATNMFNRVGAHDISKLSNSFVGNLK